MTKPHDNLAFAHLQGFYDYITRGPQFRHLHPDSGDWNDAYDRGRKEAETLALESKDWKLPKGERCWITAGNASVLINAEGEGVVVDIFPVGSEEGESVASTWAHDNELLGDED